MPNHNDFKSALLKALKEMGGESEAPQLGYPRVEKELEITNVAYPELYEMDGYGDIKWQNNIRFARQYLKEKVALECPEYGKWVLTSRGEEMLNKANEFLSKLDKNSMPEEEYSFLRNYILSRIMR
jgi:hypothetical protein